MQPLPDRVVVVALVATVGSCFALVFWFLRLQPPQQLNRGIEQLFGFVFGGTWTPTIAAFIGWLGLVGFVVGLLQWLLVRLPKFGRVAGGF